MILLSYLGAHWVLFILVVLAVIALSAGAWFLKNWKLAAAAIVIVVAGLAYQAADMEGYKRKVSEDAQAQVQTLQRQLAKEHLSAALDAQRATADAYFNTKLDALSRETPYNPSPCLALDAVRRVRAVTSAHPGKPRPARRLTSLFQGRSGAP